MGKGDKRRPMKVSSKEYSDNWDKIFKKKSGRVSFSEQVSKEDKKCETTVGVLFHPEDPNLRKNKSVELGGRKGRSECCFLQRILSVVKRVSK